MTPQDSPAVDDDQLSLLEEFKGLFEMKKS